MNVLFIQSLSLIIFFFADLSVILSSGGPLLLAIFCHSLVLLLTQGCHPLFFVGVFLLGVESMIAFDIFGLNYPYLIPLFVLLYYTAHYLASREIAALISLIVIMLCQTLFLHYFGLKQAYLGICTFYQFGANLLVLLISLKWLSTVERGNRF